MNILRPNPEPWSDARPRVLFRTKYGDRVILDAEDEVIVEEERKDALGRSAFIRVDNAHARDSVNLVFDDFVMDQFSADGAAGIVISDGSEAIGVPAFTYPVGRRFPIRPNHVEVYRRTVPSVLSKRTCAGMMPPPYPGARSTTTAATTPTTPTTASTTSPMTSWAWRSISCV